jgi:hypothetical protein
MAKKNFKTKMINVRELCRVGGVSIFKIYNRRHVKTLKPIDLVDRTKLLNALIKEVTKFSKELGFQISFTLEDLQTNRPDQVEKESV